MDTVLRGLSLYILLLVIVRFSGRRTMAQMTPFDLVLVLVISETTQQAMVGEDNSITNALVLIVTLFTVDIGLSYLKGLWPMAALAIDGAPTVLIRNGKVDERALKRARISMDDVLLAARLEGIDGPEAIRFAVLEIGGQISIIPFPEPKD